MAEMNRREMCSAMAALALFAGGVARAEAEGQSTGEATLSSSHVYRFSDLVEKKNTANGGWGRAVLHGTLPTGEFVEVHESMLPPGKMPHPPHKHSNSEFILLRQGTVDYLSDGKREPVAPGDVIYTASNKPHGMINNGSVDAVYYVVSVGVQPGATPVDLKPPAA